MARTARKSSWLRRSRGRTSLLLAGVIGNVLCDRFDLGVAQDVLERRHSAAAVDHLPLHRGERRLELVEVRADGAVRSGCRERVTAAAPRLEDGRSIRPADLHRLDETVLAGLCRNE